MKHKHAELIHLWADGAEIEVKGTSPYGWMPDSSPSWHDKLEYRIKPEPKPDLVRFAIISDIKDIYDYGIITNACFSLLGANLKITYDGETGKPKSVEFIK